MPDYSARQLKVMPFCLVRGIVLLAVLMLGGTSHAQLSEATPESQGISSSVLSGMSARVRASGDDLRSMILVREGKMVFEWYAAGVTREHRHPIYSVTKSVVGTLAGCAVDQGLIQNEDVTLGKLFPNSKPLAADKAKSAITLGNLLTMRSGLPCSRGNRPSGPERELFDRLQQAPNRLNAILALKMTGTPGEKFVYGNIEPQLVSLAIERAAGQKILPYARRTLFEPMGFARYEWRFADQQGAVPGGYGIWLRTIDMAKLGQLYLQQGRWGTSQLVSANWIRKAASDLTGTGYGYYWWTAIPVAGHVSYAAKGVRGQRIQVVPDLKLVFAVNAELPTERINPVLDGLMKTIVAEAVQSDSPIAADTQARSELQQELTRARAYMPASRKNLPQARLPQPP